LSCNTTAVYEPIKEWQSPIYINITFVTSFMNDHKVSLSRRAIYEWRHCQYKMDNYFCKFVWSVNWDLRFDCCCFDVAVVVVVVVIGIRVTDDRNWKPFTRAWGGPLISICNDIYQSTIVKSLKDLASKVSISSTFFARIFLYEFLAPSQT